MNKKILLGLLALGSTASLAHAAIVVNGDFESATPGTNTLTIDTSPDVVTNLDAGWTTISGDVTILATGGNPDQWADLSDAAPSTSPQYMANIFSAAGPYTQDQVLQFDYDLSGLSGTPDFSDNNVVVKLFGTNINNQTNNTRIQRDAIGDAWTALTTIDLTPTAATSGFVTAESSIITAATMNSYAYYGLRVLVYNVADGGGQPGVEQLKLDNFEIVAVPEPSVYALLGGFLSLGLVLYRRQTR